MTSIVQQRLDRVRKDIEIIKGLLKTATGKTRREHRDNLRIWENLEKIYEREIKGGI